jgi:hypothetical protein
VKSIKLKSLLNEEFFPNPTLNKKVLKFIDDYIGKDYKNGSPEYQWAFKTILKGALTDANFHSESAKVDKLFPRAKMPDNYDENHESIIEDKGTQIAKWAKWNGYEIIQAFVYVASLRIGKPVGDKIESLL